MELEQDKITELNEQYHTAESELSATNCDRAKCRERLAIPEVDFEQARARVESAWKQYEKEAMDTEKALRICLEDVLKR